jgi:hypothetical protein
MGRAVKQLNPQQEINPTDEANARQEATLQELEQRMGDSRLGEAIGNRVGIQRPIERPPQRPPQRPIQRPIQRLPQQPQIPGRPAQTPPSGLANLLGGRLGAKYGESKLQQPNLTSPDRPKAAMNQPMGRVNGKQMTVPFPEAQNALSNEQMFFDGGLVPDLSNIFDVNKANEDLQLAKQGQSVPGMQVMGYGNDKINEQDIDTGTELKRQAPEQKQKTPSDYEYVRSKSFKFSNAVEPENVNVAQGVEDSTMDLDPRKKAIMSILKGGA